MKHLHFVQSLEPLQGGGLGSAALELHQSFRQLGSDSRLISTRRGPGNGAAPGASEYRRVGPEKAYFSLELAAKADSLVSNADIVHGHGFYVATNWILGRTSRRMRKDFVYHPHGFFEPWILRRSRFKKMLAHSLFERENFTHARLWRALTGKEADQIRRRGIRAPVVIAPNGIRLESIDSVPDAPPPKSRRRVLYLGRLHPKKGLDLLLGAWAACSPQAGEWELIIAGPDEAGYQRRLQALVDALALEPQVRFFSTVTGAEKVRLLRSADLFVLPSHSEGFSMAILESMACRVPVLATRACNFPALARRGAGWECDTDLPSLAASLTRALGASDEERRDRGKEARKLVEDDFSWPVVAATIIEAVAHYCR